MEPDERFVTLKGFPTHLYLWNAGATGRLIFIVPGNPGVGSFYLSFARTLVAGGLENCGVAIVGHSGHFVDPANEHERYVGLREQADHKSAVLDYLRNDIYQPDEIILLAHSIGSWISLELRHKRPELNLRIFHLCPTFRNLYEGFSPGVKLAIWPRVTWTLACVIHYLPIVVRKGFIWLAGQADTDEIRLVAEEHADFYVVRNILKMASEEASEVRETKEEHLNQMRAGKDWFFFSQIDHYVPLSFVDDLRLSVPNAEIVIAEKHIEHAFVIGHAEEVAEICLKKLRE